MGKSKSAKKENGAAKVKKVVEKAVEKVAKKEKSSSKVDKKEKSSPKEDKKAKKEAKKLAELEALKKKEEEEEEESDSESEADSSASEDESESDSGSDSKDSSDADSSASESESESDASASDEPKPKSKAAVTADSSDEAEDSSKEEEDTSSSSEADSDVEMNEGSDSGKRKADDSDVEMDDSDEEKAKPAASAKKQKTETEETASVFVGNLPFSATEESLSDVFGEFGKVTGARIATQADSGRSRGFGYVDFASAEARDKALAATHLEIEGRQLRMEKTESGARSGKPPARGAQPPTNDPSKTLFMGNLSFHSTEEGIRQAFAECGNVVSVRIVTDRDTGRPKGFGYIEFDSLEAAASAMEWNGSDLDGRNVRLDYSAPRPNGGGAPRGGGRGGGRGRGGGGRRFGNSNY
ncbi:nuclear localization sequence binding protein [Coemansia sp. RSA 988]|nr:nuclear localization sequence binding protein [Coemansia sp. RSA 988]